MEILGCGLPYRTRHLRFREEEAEDEPDSGAPTDADGEAVVVIGQVIIGGRELRLEQLPENLLEWGPTLEMVDEVVDSHRNTLLMNGKVIELGCGAGLPSLVCAIMGGNVIATDQPSALQPLWRNAIATGYPQCIWKVVAGKVAGGVVVSKGLGAGQEKEPTRLSWGALVEQLDKVGDYLQYRLLAGTGPESGWVRIRQPWGQVVCEPTDDRPEEVDLSRGTLRSYPLQWSAAAALELLEREGNVDLILASDCVSEALYGLPAMQGLVDCLEVLCGPQSTALLAVQRRTDGLEDFIADLRTRLFVDKLSCTAADASLYVVRRRTRSEHFHVELNAGMRHAPPGSAVKVIRGLRESQSRGGSKVSDRSKSSPMLGQSRTGPSRLGESRSASRLQEAPGRVVSKTGRG